VAQGINNRVRLALPMSGSEEDTRHSLQRWANGLPFGAVGFHFTRASDDSAIANTATGTITWTAVVEDRENWMPATGSTTSITVPAGLSGIYVINCCLAWDTTVTALTPRVEVNGSPITTPWSYHLTTDRWEASSTWPLNDGDVLEVKMTNASGASRTPKFYSAVGDRVRPYISAWRISLL